MKILWIPQISSVSKTTGNFILDSDSNTVTYLNYAKELHRRRIETHVLFPRLDQLDEESSKNVLENDFVIPLHVEYEKNVFLSRFKLDYKQVEFVLKEGRYDWIIMHDPALVMDIKVLLNKANSRKTKIACWIHWIDTPLFPKTDGYFIYAYRQLEGLMYADVAITVSNTAYREVCGMASAYLTKTKASEIRKKVEVITNPIDWDLYKDHLGTPYNTPTLLFNHRTSTFSLYKKNMDRFLATVKYVKKKIDINVIMTNPTGYKILPELKDIVTEWGPFSRHEYLTKLGKQPFITAFFDHPPLWPYAHLESAALGCPQIVPKEIPYTNMLGQNYAGLYEKGNYISAAEQILSLANNHLFLKQLAAQTSLGIRNYHNSKLRLDDVLLAMGEIEQ